MYKELPEKINIVNPLISILDDETRQKAEEMIFDNHQRRIR